MKRSLTLVASLLLLVSLLVAGCKSEEPAEAAMPPLKPGQEAEMIEITADDFAAKNHIVYEVDLVKPGSLIVSLAANPTTGMDWSTARINPASIITEASYAFVPPASEGNVLGASGKSVWVFDSLQTGTATIQMSYGQPWDGGSKDVWTLTINVQVQ